MINIFRGYVRTLDKKPIQKFKDVDDLLTQEEASVFDEYAGILNNDFCVMDVDDGDESDRIYNLVLSKDINCRIVKTTRGKHFIFKKNEELKLKGTTKNVNSLGITFDIRVGVNQYIVVKSKGVVREVLKEFDEAQDIDLYPREFAPIKCDTKLVGLKDGDGRNGILFTHIATLYRTGFEVDEIKEICDDINKFIFDEPLKASEMKTLLRDESFVNLTRSSAIDDFGTILTYKPKEPTELAMAELFSKYYFDVLRYNSSTDWLVWNGKVWEMDKLKAPLKYFEFIKKVNKVAKSELFEAMKSGNDDKQKQAENYARFIKKMQDGNKISSVLNLAKSFLTINISELDSNPFDLNTPEGIYDVRTNTLKPHDSRAFCTKITNCSVVDDDPTLWVSLLEIVTKGDKEYQNFLQVLCGTFLIGKVFNESLVIAQGGGHNGKSTVFNVISKVLGDYAGKIPAESLTTRAKNVKVDLATLLGKRFILASETEEGQRLSNSMLKQIASTDAISAERKFHDPFTFEPSHNALLYTNYLPSLGSLDDGTKRRITICPFNAVITSPIKDYADRLYKESKGIILKWLLEGAKKYYQAKYILPSCKVCEVAKEQYIKDNDWLKRFISDCCIEGELEKQGSSILYKAYKQWCNDVGEYPKRTTDFAHALLQAGYVSKRTKKGIEWNGLALDPERLIGKVLYSSQIL